MDYTVACDADFNVESQLQGPFNVQGIPHAFIVDHNNVIQFSGHPMDPNFESTLDRCAQAAKPAPQKVTASKEELLAMKPKELKAILTSHNVSSVGCLEKSDFVDLILEKCT
eukprot:TRINITY_DN837_c0_g1_i1.p2 TRINITY_DN837_c0_g1~~TRINITY_DN837_c0_g1_i1.p2  ORF type:complete len:112 (+),score=22.42 TRINITY_DN837_c0_g1_i1:548-883(+)